MLIDWFTVGAQLINFLVLVWLMKRFLYGPILAAIDAREEHVASELADAEAKRAEAQEQRVAFEEKNEAFDQERTALLSQARAAAKAEGLKLEDVARERASALAARRQEALNNEAHDLAGAIAHRTRDEVFAIARKTLTDLADGSLEERICEAFIRRLRQMDDEARDNLRGAAANTSAVVRSAFELPPTQRAAVQEAINDVFGAEVQVRYACAPDVVAGIELAANGQMVSWSIGDYLGALQKSIGELIGEQAASPPERPSGSEADPEEVADARAA